MPPTFCDFEENTNTELKREGAGLVVIEFVVMALEQVVTPTSLWQAICQRSTTRKVRAKLVVTTNWAMDLTLVKRIVGNTDLLPGWKFLLSQLEIQESTSYT